MIKLLVTGINKVSPDPTEDPLVNVHVSPCQVPPSVLVQVSLFKSKVDAALTDTNRVATTM